MTEKFCKIHDSSDRIIDDNDGRFCLHNEFAKSPKRVDEIVVNEVHGFSNGQIDDKGKSCVVVCDNIVVLGKKIINKLYHPAEKKLLEKSLATSTFN